MRDEWALNRITTGMEVCDRDGATIGTVAHVHRAAVPVGTQVTADHADGVIEVKTGGLIFGHRYWVPTTAVESVEECIALNLAKEGMSDFERKPDYLTA